MKLAVRIVISVGVLAVATAVLWDRPGKDAEKRNPSALSIRPSLDSDSKSQRIRINVTPRNSSGFDIAIDGPFVVRSTAGGRVLLRGRQLDRTRVSAKSGVIQIGRHTFRAASVEIVPERSPAVWVGTHQYRGVVRLIRRRGKPLLAVNVCGLEDYVASVVNGETPATFHIEARKAQAIAIRSFVLYEAARRRSGEFDVYADSRSQQYPGFQYRTQSGRRLAGDNAASRSIANATRGLVCAYRGRLYHSYYSAVCGGRTLLGSEVFSDAGPPCTGSACQWCRPAKRYRWKVDFDRSSAARLFKKSFTKDGLRFDRLTTIRRDPTYSAGRLPRFFVSDGRRRYRLTGAEIRGILVGARLPSSRFDVTLTAGSLTFHGQGHGHGVGMCQWGAAGMAKAGHSAEQILKHYYRGIELKQFAKLPR